MSTPSSPARPSVVALGALVASAAATAGLAVYQWNELLVVRNGGTVACAINETINCATVWNSPLASKLHELLGMPVAALGVVWGVGALVLAGLLWRKAPTDDWPVFAASVKGWALAGLLSVFGFAYASYAAHALCLTCLGTYALVIAYAVAAFGLLPPPRWPETRWLLGGTAWIFVVGAPTFLLTLIPGGSTPKAGQVTRLEGTNEAELYDSLENLPRREAMITAAARKKWKEGARKDVSDLPTRLASGPANAPVKVVEFSDILCGHCAAFELAIDELRRAAPEGTLSIEPRYFPLVDDGCRAPAEKDSIKDVRCTGAKAQLCSESHPLYWQVRQRLFASQNDLRSSDAVLEVVTAVTGISREALTTCIASPETQAKLDDDVTYAKRYDLQGTPLVILNGRETWPSSGFVLGMALSRGDADAPFFQRLPEPPPMAEH